MAWEAEYYSGVTPSGTPLVTRTEESISLSVEDDLPKEVKEKTPVFVAQWMRPAGPNENFSARWTQSINGPGTFRFSGKAADGIRIRVDGSLIINEWSPEDINLSQNALIMKVAMRSTTDFSAEKYLSSGPHLVEVEYYQTIATFQASVSIERIGGQSEEEVQLAWAAVTQKGRLTEGGLEAARIYEADDDGNPIFGSAYEIMYCMFNPVSYKIKKSSKFTIKGLDEDKNYSVSFEMDKIEPSTLTIKELWFDTSETLDGNGRPQDVSEYTDLLMDYAEITAGQMVDFKTAQTAGAPPPKIAFQWGSFRFLGVIESLSVKFVMFAPDGTPIRAKVSNLKLTEFRHRKAYPKQNPSSGDGPTDRIWRVTEGERLDTIAAHLYGDATLWRRIANHNRLMNPMQLQPGQLLRIPPI